MSTNNPAPQFRPLTRKDMEEYEKELQATQANENALEEPTPPPADPETPPAPPSQPEVDWKKRFSDQTAYLNEQIALRKDLEKRVEALEAKLNQQAQPKYATDEDLARFESEVSTTPVLKELIRREALKLIADSEKKFKTESDEEKALGRKQAEDVAKLSKAHPDWTEFDNGGSLHSLFSGWLDKQSPTIQKLADYTTTRDMDGTIAVLNMFKAEVKVAKPASSTKNPVGSNPASRSPTQVPTQKEGAFSVTEWEVKYDAASRSGNKALEKQLMADMQKAKSEGRLVL